MSPSQPSEQELLQNILQPLLTDFEYWFSRSIELLTNQRISFLSASEQSDLLGRVEHAQQEVKVSQMLFQATGQQVGIEPRQMLVWHKLVSECWQVSMQFRQSQQTKLE